MATALTIEQAQAQLEAAKQAEREARQRAQEQARQDAIAKENTIKDRIRASLMAEVVKLVPSAKMEEGKITFDHGKNYDQGFTTNVNEDGTSGWRGSGNGKYSLKVSRGYAHTLRLPQRKDGTHDYARGAAFIADTIKNEQYRREQDEKRNAIRTSNQDAAAALSTKHRRTVSPSEYDEGRVSVSLDLRMGGSPESMDAFLAELQASIDKFNEANKANS